MKNTIKIGVSQFSNCSHNTQNPWFSPMNHALLIDFGVRFQDSLSLFPAFCLQVPCQPLRIVDARGAHKHRARRAVRRAHRAHHSGPLSLFAGVDFVVLITTLAGLVAGNGTHLGGDLRVGQLPKIALSRIKEQT